MTVQEVQLDHALPGWFWIALGPEGQDQALSATVKAVREKVVELGHEPWPHHAQKVDLDEAAQLAIIRVIVFYDDEGGAEPPIDPTLLD